MRFANTQVFNIDGAIRGMRFAMKSEKQSDTKNDVIGMNDLQLANKLWRASETDNLAHSKFLRQIFVSVDISAPLYFWSEMDTYKVGTVANSESTMHKLTQDSKNLTLNDFEVSVHDSIAARYIQFMIIPVLKEIANDEAISNIEKLVTLKQILPTSYIQKRHWTANYEVIRNIYKQRKNHRLTEWKEDFADWVKTLPYSAMFLTKTLP